MRFALDLYVNLRPFKAGPGRYNDGVDFLVVRENTEGTYAGEGGFLRQGTPHEIATQGSVNTRMGVERCVRYAFELAAVARPQAPHARAQDQRAHLRRRPLAADVRRGGAPSIADVATAYNHVDAACIYFVQDPQRYDVIVTDNLFGDILTDLGGAIGGGIGRAASANLNPARTGPVAVRAGPRLGPRHRRAPGKADPRAAIISAAMMLRFPGRGAMLPARIQKAVRHDRRCKGHDHADRRRDRRRLLTSCTTKGTEMPITPTEKIWMNGELVAVGRRADPRPHALAALRHRRLRGHPRVRDRARPRRVPAHRAHRAAASTRPRS